MELKSPKDILELQPVHHPAGEESRTKQSERELTDVNTIVARHRKGAAVTHINGRVPQYGDFTQASNLFDAHLAVQDARDAFSELPAAVRRAADYDPVRLLEMLAEEEGTRDLVEAGLEATLLEREPAPPEAAAEAATEASTASTPPPAAQPGDSDQGAT